MKIALFSDTFSPQINGVTNTLDKLINYFEENNIEYKLFVPMYDEKEENPNTERFYSLKFFLYPECRIALPNQFRVTQALSDFKPDIIHLMTEFNMGIAGLNYGKKHKIPTISSYTTNFSQYTDYYNLELLKQPIWEYIKWFHNQTAITLCPSYESQKLLNSNGIYNTGIFSRGIDMERFSPNLRNINLRKKLGIDDKMVFSYVGRVSFEKDMDVLSKSYHQIKEEYKDKVALLITGDGPYLDTCKEIFPEDTIFLGFKKGKDLSEIYASSDIFVCPSSTETFGNVVLEAMASGLGVIGADAGGVKDIIEHKHNGLKFKAKNSQELYRCMKELIDNKNLRDFIKSNGMKYSKTRSWNKIIDGLINIYDNTLKERRTYSA